MSGEPPPRTWPLAEPLTERVAVLRSRAKPTRGSPRGSERARRWREEFPFGDERLFAQRLAADHINEAEFVAVVDNVTNVLRSPGELVWARTLVDAYLGSQRSSGSALTGLSPSPADALFPFLRCAAPLIGHFAEALRDNATRLAEDPLALYDAPAVHRMFLSELLETYKRMLAPTLLLELNLGRLTRQLAGASPAERFGKFIGGLDNRADALLRLARYPVLARQLVVRGEHWLASTLTFLRDLASDLPAIGDWLDRGVPVGRLTAVQAHLGDSHCGGRSVVVATFGSGLRLVYKPRSLAVDMHFQELLAWISARADGLAFKTVNILDRATHGWMEFAYPADCESSDGVRRFYERHGGQLALLYLLNGSDFHCENVIAAGEHPVLVDMEALFHARVQPDRPSIHGVAAQGWETSVLRTGLLPTPGALGRRSAAAGSKRARRVTAPAEPTGSVVSRRRGN